MASVALSHGINANVVRKWPPLYRGQPATALPAFIALHTELKSPPMAAVIIELPLDQQTLTVKWSASDPEGCARFIRSLSQ